MNAAVSPIDLTSGSLRLRMDLNRGASITFLGFGGGENLLAEFGEPEGGVDASTEPGLLWLSAYRGGWQEMFPNAGDACVVDGAAHATHGDASVEAWRLVDRSDNEATVEFRHAGSGLHLTRHVQVDERASTFRLTSAVSNRGDVARPYLWGHHPAFAVTPGDRLSIATTEIVAADPQPALSDVRPGVVGSWPSVAGATAPDIDLGVVPDAATERVCYLPDIAVPHLALRRERLGCTIHVDWSADVFPHAWYWLNRSATRYPFEGRVTSVAVEPVSAWPGSGLADAIQRGRASWLEPGERREGEVVVCVET